MNYAKAFFNVLGFFQIASDFLVGASALKVHECKIVPHSICIPSKFQEFQIGVPSSEVA